MSREKEIALKLMGIKERCEHCHYWEKKIHPDWGWCNSVDAHLNAPGPVLFKNEPPTTLWEDSCSNFRPQTSEENPDEDPL